MNISAINYFDIANGKGIRISIFVSGCKFHCEGCFNSQAQDFNNGFEYNATVYESIRKRLLTNPDYKGISILGGDPLWQSPQDMFELQHLCQLAHKLNKDVWLWTGFNWEYIFAEHITECMIDTYRAKQLLLNCDYVVDGLYIQEFRDITIPWRGSLNQRIIDVKSTLQYGKVVEIEQV